ncbi:hypothetical protein ASD65_11710 [Microbacterium sp. Root61]|nr:hypothetical protein ASD65_11710 [Microbacterium sp. Root61]
MSDVIALSSPLEPISGVSAFRDTSPSAIASRAGQYLGMSAYAFGGDDLARGVQDDADALGVPHVQGATPELEGWFDPDALDDLTDRALQHHWGRSWDGTYDAEGAAALWEELDTTHLPTTLLALLNYAQRSDEELEAVAAAGSLAIITGQEAAQSSESLRRGFDSRDPLTQGVAAALTGWTTTGEAAPAQPSRPRIVGPTSTPIHGTWGLVTDTGWHKPGSSLHDHLRETVTGNLYDDDTYYFWSGEYSDQARADGARDLAIWRDVVSDTAWLDTVYAHSHGGNVALNALAAGQQIKMLVLLHTPAISRSAEEWATIRANVGGVIAMRTRMDLVVLGDSLKHFENRLKFNPRNLPHFPVVGHWKHGDAWLSHAHYITTDNWVSEDLADIVRTRYALIGRG